MDRQEARELVELIDYCLKHKHTRPEDYFTEKIADIMDQKLDRIAELLTE